MNNIRFEKIFNRFAESKHINECVLLIENTDGDFSFCRGYGGMKPDSLMLAASITKMFTAACIVILCGQKKLSLDSKVTGFFDNAVLSGIHNYCGKDYTSELTISDLLFQTTGLPDIYEEGRHSAKDRIIREDFSLNFYETVDWDKKLSPHFAPGTEGRAHYADINYDILGEIIEKTSGSTLSEAYKNYIIKPLGLANTYLPVRETNNIPGIWYKDRKIHRPKFVISSRASGGCVTTPCDLMIFIKAFFGGKLFDKDFFSVLSKYKPLQASMQPIRYGGGHMQIKLNGFSTFFMGKGELIGHSGSTGSFAFYYPLKDLYFVGDLNQMACASLPVRLSMRLALAAE